MNENQTNTKTQSNENMVGQVMWRLVTAAVVLAITAFFYSWFSINNFLALALTAIVLDSSWLYNYEIYRSRS